MQSTTQNGLPNSANYFYLNNANADLVLGAQRHQRDLFSGSHLGIPDVTTHVGSVVHAFETLARNRTNRSYSNLVQNGEQPYEQSGSVTNSSKSLLRSSSTQNLHKNTKMSFVNNTISSDSSVATMKKKRSSDNAHKNALVDAPMNLNQPSHHYYQQQQPYILPHNQQHQFHSVPLVYHSQRIANNGKESPSRHHHTASSSTKPTSNVTTTKQQQQHQLAKQQQQLPAIPPAAHQHQLQTFRKGQQKRYVHSKCSIIVDKDNSDGDEVFYHPYSSSGQMENELNCNFNSISMDDDYRKNLFGTHPNRNGKIIHLPQIQTTKQTITTNGNYGEDIHFGRDLLNSTTTATAAATTFPKSKTIVAADGDNGTAGDIQNKRPISVPNYFLSSSRAFSNNNSPTPNFTTTSTAIPATTGNSNFIVTKKPVVNPPPSSDASTIKQTNVQRNILSHGNYTRTRPLPSPSTHQSSSRSLSTKDNNIKHNNVCDSSNYKFPDDNTNGGVVREEADDNFLRGSTVSQSFIKNVKLNNSRSRMSEFNVNASQPNIHSTTSTARSTSSTSNGFKRQRAFGSSMGATGRKICQQKRYKLDDDMMSGDELRQRFVEHHDERFDGKSLQRKSFRPNSVNRAVI